ncbi:glyoxalase/bleomycin resistance protein/dioxygenase [Agrobacterium sp. ATCC 31749]|uniref:VOC family protein n=1 Tax=Rhizobium/Agrobacterium group TaxID=227290 RepID=UPI00020DC0E8|nr:MULTISPECIES: VOC family protein [Rhizobium/Agrobacterium group]EGL65729.1 glyoxalase/bleomycin resistance protein/dioxygenase [Agrobacterium sp. ATCC 31749]MCZ7451340.1 VOC family protein [Rhizobium rhizogenes]QKX00613.1 glyoxalase/bleomycin resistance/dioxygenase family protein [Agrobacterium sp. CGMCC 11546]
MKKGLPGLRGLDHIGITVPDLDAAINFLSEVLGCIVVYRAPAFGDQTGTFMKDQLNVHPRATVRGVAFLRCGHMNLEIFEFQSSDQALDLPKNSDVGGHHIAFYVDDIETAAEHLKKYDVKMLGKPIVERDGPDLGVIWQYFLAPWGLQMELISYPDGKGYELETSDRLWNPCNA